MGKTLAGVGRLLVVRLSSLGDVLLATPVVRALRKKLPEARIDFLVRDAFADALRHNPRIDNLYELTRDEDAFADLRETLKQNRYDLVVDLQNNLRTKRLLLPYFGKVATFDKRNFEKFLLARFKVNRLASAPPIPVRYARAVSGLALDDAGAELFLPEGYPSPLPSDGEWVALAPGAKHHTKRWLPERYAELARTILEAGYRVALVGGKSDGEICASIASEAPGALDLSGEDDLFRVAAALTSCRAVVGNDSGLTHVAAAVGTPVVVVFGATVREFGFFPYNVPHAVLERNSLSCRPCSHIGGERCPESHFKCMTEISASDAFAKLKRFLA
ncbi:MAG: glycosyltransferase family 9 protein [Ignavibacteriales bacterium]|nr:glycosyltransferase family 9 protein [Ignavibacteriales bacterium]